MNGCGDGMDTDTPSALAEVAPVDRVQITEQLPRHATPGRRFNHLAPHPGCGRVGCHIDVHQVAPPMGDADQPVQCLEGESRYREQVGGPDMVTGSKGGALRHYCRTSPPSALRTGRATHRCTQLASNVPSPHRDVRSLKASAMRSSTAVRLPRLNDVACGPSPCARHYRLPGGA